MKRIITICLLLILTLGILTSCSNIKPLINELPDEKILGVVRVFINEIGDKEELQLSEHKISLFNNYLDDLTYKRNNNIFGVKTKLYDYVTYIISYENYTVKLSEHCLVVIHNGENEKEMSFSEIKPNDIFNEIDKLFK